VCIDKECNGCGTFFRSFSKILNLSSFQNPIAVYTLCIVFYMNECTLTRRLQRFMLYRLIFEPAVTFNYLTTSGGCICLCLNALVFAKAKVCRNFCKDISRWCIMCILALLCIKASKWKNVFSLHSVESRLFYVVWTQINESAIFSVLTKTPVD